MPVFLVTPEGRIMAGNREAFSLLKKNPEEVNGELGGDVFGCRYADLPGGCGNTVHCKSCTIRLTVMETLQSGKSNVKIAAYPELHHITGENRVRFLITTERVGEAVLLREEMGLLHRFTMGILASCLRCFDHWFQWHGLGGQAPVILPWGCLFPEKPCC